MTDLRPDRLTALLEHAPGTTVAVVGDVMLDRYFWGSVARVSPEAPVPVVDVDDESFHLGGAANVAANLLSLGATPLLCGVVGDDGMGRTLRNVALEQGLSDRGLVTDALRPTTVKTRVIGNNQQIVRLDREARTAVSTSVANSVLFALAEAENLGAIILEDYNKGVLTLDVIPRVLQLAAERGVPVFVDPKRENFFAYRGAFLMKPNRKEAEEALSVSLRTAQDVQRAAATLLDRLEAQNVLITLGAQGMILVESSGETSAVPTVARRVADVSGAGDTVIATLAAMTAAGATIREAATIANIAAGIVVAEPGIVTVTPRQLLDALNDYGEVHT
jgi:rfaE bifunctional protein kinase chain/domain